MNSSVFVNFRKIANSFYFYQLRFFRGKPLTSYQKMISKNNEEKKAFHFDEIPKDPLDFVVSQSLKNDIQHDDSNKSITDNISQNDAKSFLKEVSEMFWSSDDEYRKMLFYGSENKNITKSDFNCHGCGSNINCSSMYNPGYVPFEVFNLHRSNEKFMKDILCIRCFYLQQNLDPLDVSLDNEICRDVLLTKLNQYTTATIILLADMTDLPWSVPEDLKDLLLPHVRLVVVGNKIDILPHHGKFKSLYIDQLKNSLKSRGIENKSIAFVELLSATDCTGIDLFIDRILSNTFYKNEPLFLVGSTNSGKSTTFNRLLKSDLCKTIAKTNVKEALVSNLPGTTLNVLRFPMVNCSKQLLDRRASAKIALSQGIINSAVDAKDNLVDSNQIIEIPVQKQTGDHLITYTYSNHKLHGSTFDEHQMKLMYDDNYVYNAEKITTKKWCYDTPGFINPDQIINYLPKRELDSLGDRNMITTPRIYVLQAGLSILMQNLARLDIVQADSHVYLCVHGILPVEIVDTADIERYLRDNDHITQYSFKDNLSSTLLRKIRSQMPHYDHRVHTIPDLMPVDIELETTGYETASGDVVLSSIGWVGICGNNGAICKLRAWTPARIGCCSRIPAMIPFSIKRKGIRKGYSREFSIQ